MGQFEIIFFFPEWCRTLGIDLGLRAGHSRTPHKSKGLFLGD